MRTGKETARQKETGVHWMDMQCYWRSREVKKRAKLVMYVSIGCTVKEVDKERRRRREQDQEGNTAFEGLFLLCATKERGRKEGKVAGCEGNWSGVGPRARTMERKGGRRREQSYSRRRR